jgi:23S rRNA G2445 N2-methylase RlmL
VNRIFVITTRGLESVSADEFAALPGVTVEQVAYRRVLASYQGSFESLLTLRTVDDVFLHAGSWQGIGRARETLNTLRRLGAQLPLDIAIEVCRQIRTIPSQPIFSITANFVGKRNYTTEEIKQACAAGIVERQGWSYSEDDAPADLNVRVFIEGETAEVGVRMGAHSLSKRPYKQGHVPGSLKPAVAAALLRLAGVRQGTRLLDPCCGAGTILIEAKATGATVFGGDIDREAVTAARLNAAEAGVIIPIQHWDARSLPIVDDSVARVISNLPWGRAVNRDVSLDSLYQEICIEIERVLLPGGQTVLLTNRPDLVKFRRLESAKQIEISLFGQTPTIMVWADL